jgi:hypothetical protein
VINAIKSREENPPFLRLRGGLVRPLSLKNLEIFSSIGGREVAECKKRIKSNLKSISFFQCRAPDTFQFERIYGQPLWELT